MAPSEREMAEAYITQVKAKMVELNSQVEQYKIHVAECEEALKEGTSDDKNSK
jgi:hypothetical protein|tara:strand:- start:44 stop:202 length:159 start_codon:yes stop_codon:yes gene_type:complete